MSLRGRWNLARARHWLRTCTRVGAEPHLAGRPTIFVGGGQLNIGARFRLASTPVGSHLVAGPAGVLDIGNDVAIGCGAAIASYQHVRIGDGTRIGPFVIIMDTNFHGGAGDQSEQHDCRPVVIGNGCRIGSRVTITRGVTIGDGAEILAGSIVSSAIPPGSCAAGGRARVIGRAGDMASRWESPAAALPDILMATLGLATPPDLGDAGIPTQLWTDTQLQGVLEALRDRFGIVLEEAIARQTGTYVNFAAAVQRANREHSEKVTGR